MNAIHLAEAHAEGPPGRYCEAGTTHGDSQMVKCMIFFSVYKSTLKSFVAVAQIVLVYSTS